MNAVCAYCGNPIDECGCGARSPVPAKDNKPGYEFRNPFAYNGAIVWPILDVCMDVIEFHFYTGDRLLEIVKVSRQLLYCLSEQNPGTDYMPLIWKMFEVAHGDRDMHVLLDNSRVTPALITMTRSEYPTEKLTWESILERYKQDAAGVCRL